jgi:hypothetical protein
MRSQEDLMSTLAPLLMILSVSAPQGPQCRAKIFWRCEAGFVDVCNVDAAAAFHQCIAQPDQFRFAK